MKHTKSLYAIVVKKNFLIMITPFSMGKTAHSQHILCIHVSFISVFPIIKMRLNYSNISLLHYTSIFQNTQVMENSDCLRQTQVLSAPEAIVTSKFWSRIQ